MLSPILTIGDSKSYKALFTALSDVGIKVEHVSFPNVVLTPDALKACSAVVMDWDLSPPNSLETLQRIQKMRPTLPVVVLGRDAAPEFSRKGQARKLADYLIVTGEEKEDLARLLEALKRVLPELRARVLTVRDLLWFRTPNENMSELLVLVDILKDERSSVLIQGENGTGKEVLARLLHFSGRRHTESFIAINCAAIPETLLESELFGHEKGSFTGATEKRIGKFELAHKGTIFLDEIGDMPLNTQAKILRVVETAEIERVGGHEKIPVDIRIIAATNKNLLQQIEKGNFRQDLYYRINTFTLSIPPLRERKEDVLPLARHFLDIYARSRRGGAKKRLAPAAETLLLSHSWPGNVRELRNVMERAVVLAAGNIIGPELLPEEIRDKRASAVAAVAHTQASPAPVSGQAPIIPLRELERKAIIEAVSRSGNNATRAAKHLGISKATLFRKLKKYGFSRQITIKS